MSRTSLIESFPFQIGNLLGIMLNPFIAIESHLCINLLLGLMSPDKKGGNGLGKVYAGISLFWAEDDRSRQRVTHVGPSFVPGYPE